MRSFVPSQAHGSCVQLVARGTRCPRHREAETASKGNGGRGKAAAARRGVRTEPRVSTKGGAASQEAGTAAAASDRQRRGSPAAPGPRRGPAPARRPGPAAHTAALLRPPLSSASPGLRPGSPPRGSASDRVAEKPGAARRRRYSPSRSQPPPPPPCFLRVPVMTSRRLTCLRDSQQHPAGRGPLPGGKRGALRGRGGEPGACVLSAGKGAGRGRWCTRRMRQLFFPLFLFFFFFLFPPQRGNLT